MPGFVLTGSSVYIYSFLDARERTFGPKLIKEFDACFTAALKGAAVSSTLLHFRDSEHGGYFAPVSGAMANPVRQTVYLNAAVERKAGARHRLSIEPISVTSSGSWQLYDIRWTLSDASTSALIWTTTSTGKHMSWWTADESADERVQGIVDEIIRQMKTSKLI